MITKQSTINQIEITEGATVQFRIALEVVENEEVLSRTWHRSAIEKGGDVDAQMAAVNAHLASMGWPAVSDYASLSAHCALAAQDT